MSVPQMRYAEPSGSPSHIPSFAPPVMQEVRHQVYELPPQPTQPVPEGDGGGYAMEVKAQDIELLQIHRAKPQVSYGYSVQGGGQSPVSASPVSVFSGPALEGSGTHTPLAPNEMRDRSMSCASELSQPFRHDPYAEHDVCSEAVFAESVGHRTPTPPPLGSSPGLSPHSYCYNTPACPTLLSLDAPTQCCPSFSYVLPARSQVADAQQGVQGVVVQGAYRHHSPTRGTRPESIYSSSNSNGTPPSPVPAGPEKQKKKPKKEGKKAVAAMLVKFKHGREGEYYCDEGRGIGTHVIIEGQRGQDLGIVASCTTVDNKARAERRRRRVRRDATPEEVEVWRGELFREEEAALSHMKHQVTKHNVPIVVHRAEFQFDRKKLTFHYTTKVAKPDFRAVLHDGFKQFKVRIWMNNCDPTSSEPGDRIDLNSDHLPSLHR